MPRAPDPELRRWWQRLISSYDSSGLSIAAFCKQRDVSAASFYAWRRKLLREGATPTPTAPAASSFIAVELTPSLGQPIEVHLPGGVRLDVPASERGFLMDLVQELTGREETTL
jgi:transposase-like protein